jgi:SH3-like domain-containing protein
MPRRTLLLAALLGVGVSAGWVTAAGDDGPPVMSVQVREGQLREAPSFLAPVVARLPYAAPVELLAADDGWREVRPVDGEGSGWLHGSALTPRRLVLVADSRKLRKKIADQQELALAGRSFQDEVEAKYRKKKEELAPGYQRLDHLLATSEEPTPEELAHFREEGGLESIPGPATTSEPGEPSDGGGEYGAEDGR